MCPFPLYLSGFPVPCGKCGHCLKRKIQDYTLRLQEEWRASKRALFLTFTYEKTDGHLRKLDLQLLFKRLRKAGKVFSYFALGDYGDTFGRPHYHVLFFDRSEILVDDFEDIWRAGSDQVCVRGFVDCSPVTFGRIGYVVRYGYLAKLDWCKDDARPKPFFLMSKRPAIGSSYVTSEMAEFHQRGREFFISLMVSIRRLCRGTIGINLFLRKFVSGMQQLIFWKRKNVLT